MCNLIYSVKLSKNVYQAVIASSIKVQDPVLLGKAAPEKWCIKFILNVSPSFFFSV